MTSIYIGTDCALDNSSRCFSSSILSLENGQERCVFVCERESEREKERDRDSKSRTSQVLYVSADPLEII